MQACMNTYFVYPVNHTKNPVAVLTAKTAFRRKRTGPIVTALSYCNSLLYNIASKNIQKFQCVQQCLARVVTRSPRFSHSVPLLKPLHWLPVQFRIIFKLLTIAYELVLLENLHIYFPSFL